MSPKKASVLLAGTLLVAGLVLTVMIMPAGEASAQEAVEYNYAVKFVCGHQREPFNNKYPVASGYYATDINILNPFPNDEVEIKKLVSVLFHGEEPVGREPRTVYPSGNDGVLLNPVAATMDDCYRIREILKLKPEDTELLVGFFQIRSRIELVVDAVYTTGNEQQTSPAIEVERIRPTVLQ
jgi:hypothetical protein